MSLELDIRRIHSDRIIDNKNCEICEIDLLCVGDKFVLPNGTVGGLVIGDIYHGVVKITYYNKMYITILDTKRGSYNLTMDRVDECFTSDYISDYRDSIIDLFIV